MNEIYLSLINVFKQTTKLISHLKYTNHIQHVVWRAVIFLKINILHKEVVISLQYTNDVLYMTHFFCSYKLSVRVTPHHTNNAATNINDRNQ
jgi:hypothetical protein